MHGLPGHHPVRQPGPGIGRDLPGSGQDRPGQPGALARRERGGLLGAARGHRVSQAGQRPGPPHMNIPLHPLSTQDPQARVRLPLVQRPARPGQDRRLPRRHRPVQHRADHRVRRRRRHRLRGPGTGPQPGHHVRGRDREDLPERGRPPGDPLSGLGGQARQQLTRQLHPGGVPHARFRADLADTPGQVRPGILDQAGHQRTVRAGGDCHQDPPVIPPGQAADHGPGQAHIQQVRIIDDHHHRDLHRDRRHRPGRPGHRARLTSRAVIPHPARRAQQPRQHRHRHRDRKPRHEPRAGFQAQRGLARYRVQVQQLSSPRRRRDPRQDLPQRGRLHRPAPRQVPVNPGDHRHRAIRLIDRVPELGQDRRTPPLRRHGEQHHAGPDPALADVLAPLLEFLQDLRLPPRH